MSDHSNSPLPASPCPSVSASSPASSPAKPFWQSTTLQGLAVLLLGRALAHYHIAASDADLQSMVTDASQVIGAAMVAVGRWKATQVLTLH